MSILSSFWDQFLESLIKDKDKNNPPVIYSLSKQLHPVELTENKIILGCENAGMKFYLESGKARAEIENHISNHAGKKMLVELQVITSTKKKAKETPLFNFSSGF